jgi:peptidoglycan/LPS O-acetylase OafA/YrhL
MSSTKRSFVTLDGLRGIAALAVVTRHAPAYFASVSIYVTSDAGTPVGPFFESYLAVDFFFVLSGFVLAHAYGRRFREGLTAVQFMTLRLIRLYPLYLLALAISALLGWRQLAHGETTYIAFFKNFSTELFFLPSPSLDDTSALFPLNVPAWSLFFELLANLGFGLVGVRLSNIKLFVIVLLAGLALSGAVAVGLFGFGALREGSMADGYQWRSFGAGCLRVIYSFFAGVLVYRLWCLSRPTFKVPPLAVVLLLIAILVAHPPLNYQTAFDLIVTIAIFPIIIWLGAGCVANNPIASIFAWLGLTSYAVYVLQSPLYYLTLRASSKMWGDTSNFGLTYGIIFVAFVFVVAMIFDRYFDSPVRSVLTAHFASRLSGRRLSLTRCHRDRDATSGSSGR